MDRLRVGVIGVGVQGKLHARTLLSLRAAELVGVADISAENRSWAESEVGVATYADYTELLPDTDAVVICMPDHLHEEVTIAALRAGKRVLLEKPMAVSTASCDRILAAAPDADALMIGQSLRFDARIIRAREVVRSGELGEIWHVKVWRCTSQAVGAGIWDRTSVAWFLGIHDIDAVRSVTGLEAEVVMADGRKILSPNWDLVHATLRLSNGALVSMENNWTLPHGRPSRADAGLRVVGEKGTIEVSLSHNDLLRVDRETNQAVYLDTYNYPSRTIEGGFALKTELDAFVSAALTGAPSPVNGLEGRANVAIIEQIEAKLAERAG